jgi:7-cyano-7-deazaguanine synthase
VGKGKAICIVSGGLDSVTMAAHMFDAGFDVEILSFDYGQRHAKELEYARRFATAFHFPWDCVSLTSLTHLISSSALTDRETLYGPRKIEVPDGHYAEETMKQTVVPNRNMIMLSIAAGVAVTRQAATIGFGVHSGDHFIYPDCRPSFVFSAGQAIIQGNEGFHNFWAVDKPEFSDAEKASLKALGAADGLRPAAPITTPFLYMTKADIAYRAIELGVPFEKTWSCYKGGVVHCGRCGTCVERLEAIHAALGKWKGERHGFDPLDLTTYRDTEYWKEAVANARK